MIEQLWKDQSSKIDQFTGAFTELQKSLDSGMLLQNTFVTSRTLDAVSQLRGLCPVLAQGLKTKLTH